MSEQPKESPEKIPFPEGRISNTDALDALEKSSGIASVTLLAQIPELRRDDLAFSIKWLSDAFNTTEVGRSNAKKTRGYITLKIPKLNVAGTAKSNISGINLSYIINVETFEINGATGFHDSDDRLMEKLGI